MPGEDLAKQPKFSWLRLGMIVLAMAVFIGLVGLPWGVHRGCYLGNAKDIQAKNDLRQIRWALKIYFEEYGVMPSGGNAQIMAALCGNNPRKIAFLEPGAKRFNSQGEFLDPWNTPYRMDASNAAFPWIYSCGKNQMDEGGKWGTDDVSSWQLFPNFWRSGD